jgi:hypothetical protein
MSRSIVRLALALGLMVGASGAALAGITEDLDAFQRRVGRYAREPLTRAEGTCMCLEQGDLRHRAGYLAQSTVDNGQTARVVLGCSVPLFGVDGTYFGGDQCEAFEILGK